MSEELRDRIAKHLDIYGKRWMFLKILFPDELSRVELEGSGINFAFKLCQHFKARGRLEILEQRFNEVFKQ